MSEIRPSERVEGYVYCLEDTLNKICRVGKTHSGEKSTRIKGQVAYYPFKLNVTKIYCNHAYNTESYLHRMFKRFKVSNSWYRITPELFMKHATAFNALGEYPYFNGRDSDPEKRGVRKWVIYVDGKISDVKLIQGGFKNSCLFEKDGKRFYVKFTEKNGYNIARKTVDTQPVKIINLTKTKEIDGYILFKYIEGVDPLLVEYCESEDKGLRYGTA